MSQPDIEKVERLDSPDPFDLARNLAQRLRSACECSSGGAVKYLWLYVSKDGVGCPSCDPDKTRPTLEQWLNVIDEAAAVGVDRLVLSAQTELSQVPQIWEIVQWAQDTHGMTVGLHIFSNSVSDAVVEKLKALDLCRLRLFVSDQTYDTLASLEQQGIKVRLAKPASDSPGHPCNMPQAMLFVNPEGELYTCGMVEGKRSYSLGNIFEGFFSKILCDPALPHSIPPESQDVLGGCEGCPPLLARYLYED